MAHVLLQESLNHGHVMLLGDAGDDRQRELELIQGLLNRQVDGLFYTSVDRHPYIDVIRERNAAGDAGPHRTASRRQHAVR